MSRFSRRPAGNGAPRHPSAGADPMMGGEATRHDGPVVDGHSAGESGPGGVDGHVGAPGLGGGRSSAGDDGARMTGLLQAVQDDYGPRISAL
jgi:hypothetical protein